MNKITYEKTVKKDSYDVIIIGSGMAGLACGVHLAEKGLSVLVIEQHFIPGGATTMFKRGDFLFEGGGHRITQVRTPGGVIYELIKKTGKDIKTVPLDPSYVVKSKTKTLHASLNIDEYSSNLMSLFPSEKNNIIKFLNDMKLICEGLAYVTSGAKIPVKLLTKYNLLLRYINKTTRDFMNRYFKDEELIIFASTVGNYTTLPLEQQSFLTFASCWSVHHGGEGMSLIEGGTKILVDTLVEYIHTHNGQVVVSKDVTKILVENKRASGVVLKDGEVIKGKVIISNASNEETYLKLLEPEYVKKSFIDKIKKQVHSGSLFQLFLGIEEGEGLDHVTTFAIDECRPDYYERVAAWDIDAITRASVITVEGKENAPPGKRSINISCLFPYDHPQNWFIKNGDKKEYNKFKEEIAEKIIKHMSFYIPDLEKRILLKNTATPLTMYRYTRATKGGLQGLAHTVEQSGKERGSLKSPVKNLYQTGQYVFPGAGIVTVCISAKMCAELVLKENFS
ncbi:MAG: NAD(P)/FAD-dependent oxidoreductase [Candidatus Eremiobacterota bacterium]